MCLCACVCCVCSTVGDWGALYALPLAPRAQGPDDHPTGNPKQHPAYLRHLTPYTSYAMRAYRFCPHQGEPGQEMYIVMSGELEVTVRDERTAPLTAEQRQKRLGFLSEGAFFGEAPVLAPRDDTGMLLRYHTIEPDR